MLTRYAIYDAEGRMVEGTEAETEHEAMCLGFQVSSKSSKSTVRFMWKHRPDTRVTCKCLPVPASEPGEARP